MKDLFRTVENIIRADINIGADDRSKGSGAIVFETSKDAQQAIRALVCEIAYTVPLIYCASHV